ncbi:hypothetical protein MRX96_055897 [Rhipicephalus microplus]
MEKLGGNCKSDQSASFQD